MPDIREGVADLDAAVIAGTIVTDSIEVSVSPTTLIGFGPSDDRKAVS